MTTPGLPRTPGQPSSGQWNSAGRPTSGAGPDRTSESTVPATRQPTGGTRQRGTGSGQTRRERTSRRHRGR